MKMKINWKLFLAFFIITGGLYYVTRNVWLAAGIMLILLFIDGFLREYEMKKKGEKQAQDILKSLEEEEKNNKKETK